MVQVHEFVSHVLAARPLRCRHGDWISPNGICGRFDVCESRSSVSYTKLYREFCLDRAERCGSWATSPKVHRQRREWPIRARAKDDSSTVRWNLDDVERISRGRPSKAKTGSRAVPHRLNAEERKEFELAKKRAYLVEKANGRRYPLVNTYRNYCDALGVPCIRIEQGSGGSLDQIVIDLGPLHLSYEDHISQQEKLLVAIKEALAKDERTQISFAAEDAGIQKMEQDSKTMMSELADDKQELVDPKLADSLTNEILPLRFEANRSEAKVVSQLVVDVWRSVSITPAITQSNTV